MKADRTLKLQTHATLDPRFQPAVLENHRYLRSVRNPVPVVLGLERENGAISRYETAVNSETDTDDFDYMARIVKFLLWARGGWRIYFGGPRLLGEQIQRSYAMGGARAFDVELMSRVYERPFEVVLTNAEDVPAPNEAGAALGGHLDGCRIGFDLGASDYKIAAVKNGEVVYSDEFPWSPRKEADPLYHYRKLNEGIQKAATRLPRVDAIGGSTAGVVVNNRMMVASLFRSVPPDRFDEAKNIFLRLQKQWGVPVTVANDGDVTALAGAMSLGENGMLGIAMGSSEAVGYLTPQGGMMGWLNELAFAPVDYNPDAPADEWSGDRGVGALYFSQQAVNKLLPSAGIQLPDDMGLPERLKEVQALMAKGDPRAAGIYETVGVYLGYTISHYAEFYDFQHVLVLGRVMTGDGGGIILSVANEVLRWEFPELAERVRLHLPDEKIRRVGQAVAAASLPELRRES
jgi:predicted NBD/HSP70 family sugar kinase